MSIGCCWEDPKPSSIICWRVLPSCWVQSTCVVGVPELSSKAVAYDEDDVSLGCGSIGIDCVSDGRGWSLSSVGGS